MSKRKLFYIADFSLPNMSAYTLHVLKICDAFSEKNLDVSLFIPFKEKNYKFEKIKKKYLLKKKFKIISFFNRKINRNLIFYLFFSIKLINFTKNEKNFPIIISRSVLPALICALINKKIILEIHTELRGFTKFFFKFFKFFKFMNNIKFILIHKNLKDILKLKATDSIVLDDCVDIRDFDKKFIKKKTCAYTGSFVKGKGIDVIIETAEILKNTKFYLYGNIKTLDQNTYNLIKEKKNIILNNFVEYNKIPKILMQNKILLMPYEKEVGVLIKNLNVSDYISPLKLFDYLASGSIILASQKKVYAHVLKNNFNSVLINSFNGRAWAKKIYEIQTNKIKTSHLRKNSILTAKKFSWVKRAENIIKFSNQKN